MWSCEPTWKALQDARGLAEMGRNRERPVRQVIYQETLVKNLGSLPVVAHFLRQLDVEGIIDRAVPIREVAHLTHGETICAMVANRLTAPQPLCHFDRWAVEEVFGAKPEYLNDDRLGRALDAIAPHLEALFKGRSPGQRCRPSG